MSGSRLLRVAALDLRHNLGRPLFWIFILVLALTSWGLSTGHMRIASGDSMVGGTKAWLTSEFAVAQVLAFVVFLFYAFFIAVAAGMTVIHDDDLKVGELLHSTPLRPSEYVTGKLLAVLASFVAVLGLHLSFAMVFNHLVPNPAADEIRGPFSALNYLRPALFVALPTLFFLTTTAFAVGVWTRKPILVFVLPVALVILSTSFFWEWSPSWLDPRVNRLLMVLDPGGFRWLNETWLKVDRGVDFYNTARIGFDGTFLLNRILLLGVGLGAVLLALRSFAARLGGEKVSAKAARKAKVRAAAASPESPALDAGGVPPLTPSFGTGGRPLGFLHGAWVVARAELKELRSHAGLYLFVPLILIQTIGVTFFDVGPFDTPVLATPGWLAVRTMNTLTLLVSLLLLFYTVESLEREKSSGLSAIYLSTPIRTGSALLGKALANSFVAVVILLAALLACLIVMLIQRKVALELWPFALVWGVLLVPTFLVWTSFVMAVHSLVGNRYTTYAVALAALIFTGYRQATHQMNWVGNWDIWGVLQWSDMGTFELGRSALILNRVMVLGLTGLFVAMTIRFFARAERDASRTGHRLRPTSLVKGGLRLLPYAIVPLVAGSVLFVQVNQGFQGEPAEKKQKDYWRRNLATWRDARHPSVTAVDLDLELDPARRWFRTQGSFTLVNHHETTLRQVPLTRGLHWEKTEWSLNGEKCEPDDRVGLVVFTPERPLAPGDSLRIGFAFEGEYPKGVTKNGGGSAEFILPSGAVLTSFSPGFAPLVGYDESIGVDDKNRYETREYPDDFHEGVTEAAFGTGDQVTTRIRITGPAEYTFNSVGTRVSDEVAGGRRTTVWKSDHPVRFFNVVAGRWHAKEGEGTTIYHHPTHAYNLEEMSEALDAARRHYSEWFMEYPWQELKLSEFPALASYAQGFPTNITFSEALGFLTKSDPRANLAFMVTAHEAAHQWWGNMLLPGKGPGGNILSEGMAHFSTILLFDRVKGPRQRIEFCKRIESRYGDDRQADSERPLVKTDGSKRGDRTVMYDKGGWVFWMLLNHMGRERALAGIQEFIRHYSSNPDHAVLQDFIAVMRPHAPDPQAFDDFTRQWFHDVVVPEYRLRDAKRIERAGARTPSSGVEAGGAWEVTVEVKTVGTGRMPVEVAAVRGERFPDERAPQVRLQVAAAPKREGAPAVAAASDGARARAYEEARSVVVLNAGESQVVTIRCPFKPERILVDPDARVLQLNRDQAVAEL